MIKPTPLPAALAAVLSVSLLAGCGSSDASAAASNSPAAKPWKEMESKLGPMTPEQRAQYLKEHPEELQKLGQAGTPTSNAAPAPSNP